MESAVKRIAVTGAGGQIAYSLLFRLAAGELWGPNQPLALHLLEVPAALPALEGIRMELEDGAYPLLRSLELTSDPYRAFADIDLAILIGAKPRGAGMERKELLAENGKIFIEQGKALDQGAKADAPIIVVGNPCNTNCLIALKQCRRLRPNQLQAMTRLDQNRATALLARHAGLPVGQVARVTIWGNHSATQVPDASCALLHGRALTQEQADRAWLQDSFVKEVQQRGAHIIAARGKSSAASAAQAILDHLRELYRPTPEGEWFSMGVYAANNPYGIDEELVFSFPCRSDGKGRWSIVPDLPWSPWLEQAIRASERELLEERAALTSLGIAAGPAAVSGCNQ